MRLAGRDRVWRVGAGVLALLASVVAVALLVATLAVPVRLLDDTEMTAVAAGFLANRWQEERLEQSHRTLAALGAVASDADLATLRVETFADQVSGFFLPAENAVGVRAAPTRTRSPR